MIAMAALPWGLIARIGGPLILAAGVFGWGYSVGSAGVQRKWSDERAAMAEINREAERMAGRATEKVTNDYIAKTRRASAAAAESRADLERVRGALEASRTGPPAESACGPLAERIDVLERLLAEGAGLAQEGGRRVGSLDAKISALQSYAAEVCLGGGGGE